MLAVLAALSISGVYVVQPLLVSMGVSFGLSAGMLGWIPTTIQIAVALTILFVLPLGDIVDNRRLLIVMIVGQVLAMVAIGWSTSFTMFLVASAAMGSFTIAPYLLPAYAARLTPASRRGHVTGYMARGVILGILLARTVSGFIGAHFDWRMVYRIGALATLVVLACSLSAMPATRPDSRLSYLGLMRSLPGLFARERALRIATLTQALMFGTFSSLWIALGLYLQSPAYGLRSDAVGALGLLGAAAAMCAPLAGRLSDRVGARRVGLTAIALTMLAWLFMAFFGSAMWGLCVGIVLLDIGASSTNITKQATLFALATESRTRRMAIYIVGQYVGAGVLALATVATWAHGGWFWVCMLGTVTTGLALLANCFDPGPSAGVNASTNSYGH